jgi:hypothetical protein
MSFDSAPGDGLPQPTVSATEHETVIKFVLSGPILNGSESSAAQPAAHDAELRARVAGLERALAEAEARIDALARAVASAIQSAPVIEPLSESVELLLRHASDHDAAAPADRLDSWTAPRPTLALGSAPPPGMDSPAPPADASQPPPPQSEDLVPPKVRGLRRMATALKHL